MKLFTHTLFFFLLPLQFCFAQWVPTGTSVHNTAYLVARGSDLYAAGGFYHFVCISTDNGDSWNSIDPGLTSLPVRAITFSEENIIVGTSFARSGQIILSTDNGKSWSEILNEGTEFSSIISKDSNIIAGFLGETIYSSDSGITWDRVHNFHHIIIAFTVSGSKVFAGSENEGVFLTTDNGISWSEVNNGLTSLYVSALTASGNYIFAGTMDGIFRTTNDGANWVAFNSGIPLEEFNWVFDFAVVGTNIFASIKFNDGANNYSRVYLSTNFGEMWNDVSDGLPDEIWHITANETYLFALTESGGVWRRPLSEIITDVDENINQLPEDYNLSQNYPNPFNPSTKITYSVPQTSQVKIKVFDVLGKEIETLLNEEKPAGNYELTWNVENLPSGVYFYQLRVGDPSTSPGHSFVETKKMLLLK